jgi:ABC-type polysaccharide/polyol phosphate export permease
MFEGADATGTRFDDGGSPLKERAARYSALVRSFVWKDIRLRYAGSLMGFFWTVVRPLIELLTYTFVFTVILRVRFEEHFSTATNALFLFCGMIPWLTLSESLNRCTHAVREHAHLLRKVRFPASSLCAYIVLSEAANQLIRTVLLLLAVALVGHGLSAHSLLVLPALLLQVLFTLGIGFLLATTQVYFKDTGHLLAPVLMIWLFITPIFYPAHYFPKEFSPVLMLNPLSHLVGIYQELLLNHRLPHAGSVVIFSTCAVLLGGIGAHTFGRHAREFPDLV